MKKLKRIEHMGLHIQFNRCWSFLSNNHPESNRRSSVHSLHSKLLTSHQIFELMTAKAI